MYERFGGRTIAPGYYEGFYRDPNTGQPVQWETPSLQEQMNRTLMMRRLEAEQTGEAGAQAEIFKRQALQRYRETNGSPVPDIVIRAGLAQPGDKLLPEERTSWIEAAQKILSPEYKDVAPGASLVSVPRPSPFGTTAPMVNTVRDQQPPQYLARHIVVAITVDARRAAPLPHDVRIVVDLHAGDTPLTGHTSHHESYRSNESEGAI